MSRRPVHNGGGMRIDYIPPGAYGGEAAQTQSPLQLLGHVLRILESADNTAAGLLDAVCAVKEEVDRWEVARELPPHPVTGQRSYGPDAKPHVWTGSKWVDV